MSNQNDTMVQEAPVRNRYTPKSPPEYDVPEVPTPFLTAATATAKNVVTHKATTHGAATLLGGVVGYTYGKEFGNSRAGHLRRAITGSPNSAKSLWKRIKGWF